MAVNDLFARYGIFNYLIYDDSFYKNDKQYPAYKLRFV